MNERQKQIFLERIDEVLLYRWDPIGIGDMPEARNEYASYADQVWRMALNGKSKSDIASYLTQVTTDRLGLKQRKQADDEVAELVWSWKDYCEDAERLG